MNKQSPNTLRSVRSPDSGHGVDVFPVAQINDKLPKTVQVYELLRDAIITMRLRPGASIVEKHVCEALGISRTPLREAIIQLAAESLVIVKPGGGTFVNLIVPNEVLEGQITRDTLEKRLVRLAARHFSSSFSSDFEIALFQQEKAAETKNINEFFELDNRFHKLICECSGFPNGWRTIHGATGQVDRIRRYALPKSDHYIESLGEHRLLYEHIKNRDEEAAAEVFQVHIDHLFLEVDLVSQIDPDLVSFVSHLTVASIR